MGYRSDAQLLFYCDENDPNYAVLRLWVDENMQGELEYMETFHRAGCKGFVFSWENVKWYSDYEEIKKIEGAMKKFSELFDGAYEEGIPEFEYEFVRIGENDDDIEVKGSSGCQGLMYVNRSIEWNS